MELIVHSDLFPLGKDSNAMALWPFVIIRNGRRWSDVIDRHEKIHLRQQEEILVVAVLVTATLVIAGCKWWSLLALPLYYYLYGLLYLIQGYYNAFEREAYNNQWCSDYLKTRKHFAWIKHI